MEPYIRPYIRRTPLLEFDDVALKLELQQVSGSFKARGAFANLLTHAIPPGGVVAASGGNHGAAVAYAAAKLGIACKIFVPDVSSPAKIERIRAAAPSLVIVPGVYPDARRAAHADAHERDALIVEAYDHPTTILGAGLARQRNLKRPIPRSTRCWYRSVAADSIAGVARVVRGTRARDRGRARGSADAGLGAARRQAGRRADRKYRQRRTRGRRDRHARLSDRTTLRRTA